MILSIVALGLLLSNIKYSIKNNGINKMSWIYRLYKADYIKNALNRSYILYYAIYYLFILLQIG